MRTKSLVLEKSVSERWERMVYVVLALLVGSCRGKLTAFSER